jgi:esterase/lipase superfamily enzyme
MRTVPARPLVFRVLVLAAFGGLGGCGSPPLGLMPTPIAYAELGIDPYAHLEEHEQRTDLRVFYATNRTPTGEPGADAYGNEPSPMMHLGHATVRFGHEAVGWPDLLAASTSADREEKIMLSLEDAVELRAIDPAAVPLDEHADSLAPFAAAINAQLAETRDKQIVIYVHGAKVNFYNGCVSSAELAHFAGRDYVPMAFCWPTHQNIFAYIAGEDVERGRRAAHDLRALLEFLATRTDAEKIHVICWSAGGIVTTRALVELRDRYPGLHHDELRERLRLGTVAFAAIDVEVNRFLEELPDIHYVCERVVVTMSDHDMALEMSVKFRGGGQRIGMSADSLTRREIEVASALPRLELVDVSFAKEQREFDIVGHRYWYQHPWVSTDVLFLLRTGLPADRRGLTTVSGGHVWFFPPDYPDRVREAMQRELGDEW